MDLPNRTSAEKYNPITGVPIPAHAPRSSTSGASAIFGVSSGNIDYMFIHPLATTRPTKTSERPNTSFEKRRSLSRESLRRSAPTVTEDRPNSGQSSSISDVSECSSEADYREKTRTNSETRSRKPVARSASSRLPVSSKPCVMKRAHSFTRGTGDCVPRGQASDTRGTTNNTQESTSNSLSPRPSTGNTSKIPRKTTSFRESGAQSSRIPKTRSDVKSNVAELERSGKEGSVAKRTAQADFKISSIPGSTSGKQTSSESKKTDPTVTKRNPVSGIPSKGSKIQQHSGGSRLASGKLDGGVPRACDNATKKNKAQTIDIENDDVKSAMQAGKSTLKREGTGDELRVAKSDVTRSRLPRKSSISKNNTTKTSQQKSKNSPEMATEETNNTTGMKEAENKINISNQQIAPGEPSSRSAEVLYTSNTLQRSDSGFGDTDSVSSKEDALVAELGNEFTFSRENSRSKIPIMSRKNRTTAKSSREVTSNDEKETRADVKKSERATGKELLSVASAISECAAHAKHERNSLSCRKTEAGISDSEDVWIYKNEVDEKKVEHQGEKNEHISRKTKTDDPKSFNKHVAGLETKTRTSNTRELPNKDAEEEVCGSPDPRDKSASVNKELNSKWNTTENASEYINSQQHETKVKEKCSKQSNSLTTNISNRTEHITYKSKGNQGITNENRNNDTGNTAKDVALKRERENQIEYSEESNVDKGVETKTSNKEQAKNDSENEMVGRKAVLKRSPRKTPRSSKIQQNDGERNQELAEKQQTLSSKDEVLDNEVAALGNGVEKKAGRSPIFGEDCAAEGMGQTEGEEAGEAPRRFENCMHCRMEQSVIDGEEIPRLEDDPGFRQYPTFISPRKSLVMCQHHAKHVNDTKISCDEHEKPLISMTSLTTTKTDHKPGVENNHKKLPTSLSTLESNKGKTEQGKPRMDVKSCKMPPNSENLSNARQSTLGRSDSLKTQQKNEKIETQKSPKGTPSPLLALSRDKKFASNAKPCEDIKTALSLEWDDTGTELSPPHFSDEDDGARGGQGAIEDARGPSVKLMNTNEALDKLKVIQNLIMKEAESRSRRETEFSEKLVGKYSRRPGTENSEKQSVGAKNVRDDLTYRGDFGEDSNSTQISPSFEKPDSKIGSPTIWDRMTDNTISQHRTTELLNETLAKLKASPKLSANTFPRRTLSSRSLPGSRQPSKEQFLSDGERPVYVYTSSWKNNGGRNSPASSLSLCSNNRSLPSSRQNVTKEPFNELERSESAAGRMDSKENGKRLEPKKGKEFRLSDFDEINLSDDDVGNLKKTTTPKTSDNSHEQMQIKKSKRRKNSKNTTVTMNNLSSYGASMEDLDDGRTKCQCGRAKCVII